MTNHIAIEGVTLNGEALVVEVPSWQEELGLYDHGCSCRRCLLHDDPGGCLNREGGQ